MPDPLTALLLTDARPLALPDALQVTLAAALALCHTGDEPVTLAALAAVRRRSPVTVRRHLTLLAQQGWPLLRRVGRAWVVQADHLEGQPPAPRPQDETAPTQPPSEVKNDSGRAAAYDKEIEAKNEQHASSAVASIPSCEVVARELVALGVYPELAGGLAQLPWATPTLVRRCVAALQARKGVRSLPALLVAVLRNRQSAVAAAKAVPRRRSQAATGAAAGAPPRCAAARAADPALQAAWQRALACLQATWNPQAVALHLAGARPLGAEGGVLLLGVANTVACEWLDARAHSAVLAALAAEQPTVRDVRFVVAHNGDLAAA